VEELVFLGLVLFIWILVDDQCYEQQTSLLELSFTGSHEFFPMCVESFNPFFSSFSLDIFWISKIENIVIYWAWRSRQKS